MCDNSERCQAEFAWLWQKGWNKCDTIAAICLTYISCPADRTHACPVKVK